MILWASITQIYVHNIVQSMMHPLLFVNLFMHYDLTHIENKPLTNSRVATNVQKQTNKSIFSFSIRNKKLILMVKYALHHHFSNTRASQHQQIVSISLFINKQITYLEMHANTYMGIYIYKRDIQVRDPHKRESGMKLCYVWFLDDIIMAQRQYD